MPCHSRSKLPIIYVAFVKVCQLSLFASLATCKFVQIKPPVRVEIYMSTVGELARLSTEGGTGKTASSWNSFMKLYDRISWRNRNRPGK